MVAEDVFGNFIQLLVSLGVVDVLLPFILIFTVVFAILEKSKIIGNGAKNVNIMISLVISLLVVTPHVMGTYSGVDLVTAINTVIPKVSFWIVLVVMALLLVGAFGGSWDASSASWVPPVAFGIVFLIFGNAAGWFNIAWLKNIDPQLITLLVIVAVFVGVVVFVSTGDGENPGEVAKSIGKNLMGKK